MREVGFANGPTPQVRSVMDMPDSLPDSALLTDLYELTMAAAYFEDKFTANATFELFVRSLPPARGFLVAAGVEQALDFLERVRFRDNDIEYLRQQPVFCQISSAFFDSEELPFYGRGLGGS
jgi:nicotinic acid phosphoribosyltransferase